MTAILRARSEDDKIIVDRFDVSLPDGAGNNPLTVLSLISGAAATIDVVPEEMGRAVEYLDGVWALPARRGGYWRDQQSWIKALQAPYKTYSTVFRRIFSRQSSRLAWRIFLVLRPSRRPPERRAGVEGIDL